MPIPKEVGACMYQKEGKEERTLYAKVRLNESKKKFYTKFRKTKITKGESKEWSPLEIENERCEATGVV